MLFMVSYFAAATEDFFWLSNDLFGVRGVYMGVVLGATFAVFGAARTLDDCVLSLVGILWESGCKESFE